MILKKMPIFDVVCSVHIEFIYEQPKNEHLLVPVNLIGDMLYYVSKRSKREYKCCISIILQLLIDRVSHIISSRPTENILFHVSRKAMQAFNISK